MVNPASAILPIRKAAFSEAAFFVVCPAVLSGYRGAISVVCINFLPYPALDREEIV